MGTLRVGFVGAGRMGFPMVERLAAAGHDLVVYARRAEAEEAFEATPSMRAAPVFLAACCVVLGAVPGLLIPSLMELAPQPQSLAVEPSLSIPGTGSLPSPWLLLGLLALTGLAWRLRGSRPGWLVMGIAAGRGQGRDVRFNGGGAGGWRASERAGRPGTRAGRGVPPP